MPKDELGHGSNPMTTHEAKYIGMSAHAHPTEKLQAAHAHLKTIKSSDSMHKFRLANIAEHLKKRGV